MSDLTAVLARIGADPDVLSGGTLAVTSPIDGSEVARLRETPADALPAIIERARAAFEVWRMTPAPVRGELVRLLAEEVRTHKADLGRVISIEAGKILQEGAGEVQEVVDIGDLAVGLSRQLFGLTIASERPGHRIQEQWHPLGPTAVITAFNFPMAPWAWNAALALVCGNPVIWKPSEKAPVSALAMQAVVDRALARFGQAPDGLHQVVIGGREVGEALVESPLIPLVSATGSTRMGRQVGPKVAARFGRTILELGGNNAMIVTPSADLELAVRAILFSAVGTAGQRCTTLRRVIAHETIKDELVGRVLRAYASLPIGNPLDDGTLVGPLIDGAAFEAMERALQQARAEGGRVHGGGRVLQDAYPNAWYARPALVEMPEQTAIMREETFAPTLYMVGYRDFDEALRIHNDVPQGLSSCIFSNDVRETELFMSACGSDCGMANVNIGPSGAEIGGAFGGEKETGGGRESGSDAWRAYMRRATNTINYSPDLPLAQGINFG
jgi:aldehyde dehydrogenase (NAD+)